MAAVTVGDLIRGARDAKALTQRDVAARVGVTPGFIAKLEGDGSLPGYSVCVALASVLDIAIDELWGLVEAARLEADERRRRARGELVTGPIRTRGAVRVRGAVAAPSNRAPRGVDQIAQEIAGDADLLKAYGHLRTALHDPNLRVTVLTTLEAWARMVATPKDTGRGR